MKVSEVLRYVGKVLLARPPSLNFLRREQIVGNGTMHWGLRGGKDDCGDLLFDTTIEIRL